MHSHPHHHERSESTHRIQWLTLISVVYFFAELLGGWWSGSLALLADAAHMAVDIAAMLLALFAAWMIKRPANSQKTYGYYRAEILAALINGVSLVVASLWILYEAWERASEPHEIRGQMMAIIASGGVAVNLLGLFWLNRHKEENLNLKGLWLHLLTDTLSSFAALLAAGAVIFYGWLWVDPLVSAILSILILVSSFQLLKECVDVLLEAVPKGVDVNLISEEMKNIAGVVEVHDLHVWTLAHERVALSAHVKVKDGSSNGEILNQLIHLLEEKFHISHSTLQVEPKDFSHSDSNCH